MAWSGLRNGIVRARGVGLEGLYSRTLHPRLEEGRSGGNGALSRS